MTSPISITALAIWEQIADNIVSASVAWCDSNLYQPQSDDIREKSVCITAPAGREEMTVLTCIFQELYAKIKKQGVRTAVLYINRPNKTQVYLPMDVQIRGLKLHIEDFSLVVPNERTQPLFDHALAHLKTM